MKTIMLVDDAVTVLLAVSSILAKAGYVVIQANTAADGLTRLRAGPSIDLLITDFNMPDMDDIDFIKEVRKLPDHKFMPILFLTTESQQAAREKARDAGASGWIVKPTTTVELLETVKLVIK